MQLHILKLQTCSLKTLLSIISSALQKSQCYSCVSSFSFPLKNKKANNKTMSWELTLQYFFPCFFTVLLTNALTEKPAQNTEWWPAPKLSWSVSPKREEQQAGMIPVHTSGNLFTAATTNSMHLILKESVENCFICVIQAPWVLKLHSDCWRHLTWKEAEKYLMAFQNVPAHNLHWFLCQAG